MHLIIGGAFSGKRAFVKSKWHDASWISAYDGYQMLQWKEDNSSKAPLVLEGFEQWIMEDNNDAFKIRENWRIYLKELAELEREVIMIMLETGKGIVPISEKERRTRDLLGWIQQDAAALCKDVYHIWHGLAKKIK
ncbi:bifunctional adenosylcobinamide kinase/adenosylcobinamide-phosphate guanylyltransferase [Metabacillus idriensis]|uniref:bifunctional adenosylcobinamide kinase/adenosylcobinamide-phosphate guanylyltransferase n=1 Tax=Metabacillus idriensis TaxID=324768 RepID=UPI0017498E0E|nr:bifunctional adenosylcobinamide kinase/adenosylcobinamide-phosphate guanylyltransferase [Metabacillus idriensis]MCM3595717.1 bifunctional adenosylcobinamide kinase/adenosylcobinamide-phosphate guanylyltransferase [Metabacillus idriensis]